MSMAETEDSERTLEDEEELGAESNGRSIEDRADDGEAEVEPEDDGTGQFTIPGSRASLSLNAGGRRPDVSEAKLAAIPLSIRGEYRKGDVLRVMVDVTCTDVRMKDDRKGGAIQRTRRIHIFTPDAIEVSDI